MREARANPRQLWIHDETLEGFQELVKATRDAARQSMGHNPMLVLQLTHSGRYSRPVKRPAPIIAHHSQILDPRHNLPPDYPLIADEELDQLQHAYVKAATLAQAAGFDAVDVKACHRYLISELLASFTRENSRYGGPFENRIRLLVETVARIREALPNLEATSRLNVYDAIAYPYGWGVDKEDYRKPDLAEPLQLIAQLQRLGCHGLNITIANPYFNPHFGRPFDDPVRGGYVPEEHPLEGIERLLRMAKTVLDRFPDLTVVGTGYSWLRQFYPYFAAGAVQAGWNDVAGLGRGAFAYPDFAKDIVRRGKMDPLKVCIACSSCSQIMRDGGRAGCVPRDGEIYGEIFREGLWKDPAAVRKLASQCRNCVAPTCADHCPSGIDIPAFLRRSPRPTSGGRTASCGERTCCQRCAGSSARWRCSARATASSGAWGTRRFPSPASSVMSPSEPATKVGRRSTSPAPRRESASPSSAPAPPGLPARQACSNKATRQPSSNAPRNPAARRSA